MIRHPAQRPGRASNPPAARSKRSRWAQHAADDAAAAARLNFPP